MMKDHSMPPLDLYLEVQSVMPPFTGDYVKAIRQTVQIELNRIKNELSHLGMTVQHLGLYTDLSVITMLRYNAENAERHLDVELPGLIAERFLPKKGGSR